MLDMANTVGNVEAYPIHVKNNLLHTNCLILYVDTRFVSSRKRNYHGVKRHEFASHVVEKALQNSDRRTRADLILAILEPGTNGLCPLQTMMKDPYANYVVQKVLDFAEGSEFDKVVETIQNQSAQLKRLSCGKHILNRLEEKLTGRS